MFHKATVWLRRCGAAVLASTGVLAALALPVAAASDVLYVTPNSGNLEVGTTASVQIRVNSGSEPVNAVQANLTYDPAKLQYVAVDGTGSAYPLVADTKTTAGSIKLARATNGGQPPVTGDNLFATIKFKVLASAGVSSIAVATGSHVVRSTDAKDLLASATLSPTVSPGALPSSAADFELSGWVLLIIGLFGVGSLLTASGLFLYWYQRRTP